MYFIVIGVFLSGIFFKYLGRVGDLFFLGLGLYVDNEVSKL